MRFCFSFLLRDSISQTIGLLPLGKTNSQVKRILWTQRLVQNSRREIAGVEICREQQSGIVLKGRRAQSRRLHTEFTYVLSSTILTDPKPRETDFIIPLLTAAEMCPERAFLSPSDRETGSRTLASHAITPVTRR